VSHVRVQKILVVLTIFALVLVSADVADAKKKRKKKKNSVPTTLVVESAQGTHIAGTVESSRSGCVEERKVEITRNGNPVASADADSEGQWFTRTGGTIANGDVIIAEVEKTTVKSKKKKITCGSDSDRFVVGNQNNNNNTGGNTGGQQGTETLTVTVSGPGTVTSNPPGINCRQAAGTCERDFPEGDTVSLTAEPDTDATFTGWSGACSGTTQPCNVQMTTDRTVGATFSGGGSPSACPADVASIPTLGPVLCMIIDLLA
jgi:hypothetical protein